MQTHGKSGPCTVGSGFLKEGKKARVTVTYRYDGSAGFPAYLKAVPMVGETDQAKFYYSPVEITETGLHTSIQTVMYTGSVPLDTDKLRVVLYASSWETILCEKTVDFEAHWTP